MPLEFTKAVSLPFFVCSAIAKKTMNRCLMSVGVVAIVALSAVNAGPRTDAVSKECAISLTPDQPVHGIEKVLWCLEMLAHFDNIDDQIVMRVTCGYGHTYGRRDTSTLHSAASLQELFIVELADFMEGLFTKHGELNDFDLYHEKIKCVLRQGRLLATSAESATTGSPFNNMFVVFCIFTCCCPAHAFFGGCVCVQRCRCGLKKPSTSAPNATDSTFVLPSPMNTSVPQRPVPYYL